jgi:pimeloyl-ACP methyl ester carboxylesterase
MSVQKGTVMLVHGAWADGSCWQNVIPPLERLGLNVICAPLPVTSLTDDIAAVSRTLERADGPVVLVGHAYAGAVIAGPADDRIKALVYVSALAPGAGETVAQVFYTSDDSGKSIKVESGAVGFPARISSLTTRRIAKCSGK